MTNWHTRIGHPHSKILVAFLAGQFHVRRPRLRHSNRNANHGTYHGRKRGILLSKQVECWVIAHEFAHYLDDLAQRFRVREPHSQGFYYNLLNIIRLLTEMGLITGDYPWPSEYRQLLRWAKRDGHLVS